MPQILTRRSQSALGLGTAAGAARNGHLHILEYLVERKYDQFDDMRVVGSRMNGHLDCLKYLHETAKAPWDERTKHTRTTTPNVYNTSSTTTALYQMVGDTSTGVTRARIRIRIRILTCNNTQRERRTQTKESAS